jgi:hypothetical protein
MSILYQGVIVVDPVALPPIDWCADNPIFADQDVYPGTLFAISAMIGTVWWITSWFLYVQNTSKLMSSQSNETVPIIWFWDHLWDTNQGWTALSYLATFFTHGLVSFPELLAWIFYATGNPDWLGWWTATFGWYISTVGLFFPWMFSIFQLAFDTELGGLAQDMDKEFAHNAAFNIIMGIFQHISSMYVHVFMGPRLNCYIVAREPIRNRTIVKKCPIKREYGMTDATYQSKCKQLFAIKSEAEPEASTAPSSSSAW